MAPQIIHLPDGQNFTVTPVFAGVFFKSHELNAHKHAFPVGWSVVLQTEDAEDGNAPQDQDQDAEAGIETGQGEESRPRTRSWTEPTLQNDSLFISSISNPSSTDFKPPVSQTRQIAMMLWITLYWYFHQLAPSSTLDTEAAKLTPEAGKPRGEWRIHIRRDGVLRGRNLIPKLERMGLIASLDSSVGTAVDDDGDGWSHMFVSRRLFWQIPGRLFLFTLQPNHKSASHSSTPTGSRPVSPALNNNEPPLSPAGLSVPDSATAANHTAAPAIMLTSMSSFPIGPFFSASHLPTYYPPGPVQYVTTNQVRHPLRPKPPRMGEVFYTRFVPSVGQYLSFRVASLSPSPVPYLGPIGPNPPSLTTTARPAALSDTALLQAWMGHARVQAFWGKWHANFLSQALASRHSFPVVGLWDGVPFGYFELYWVREDVLGRHLGGGGADDWDRGLHVFIGEEWARGRVQSWLSSLAHWAFCADYRTMSVCIEPRVDNARFIQHLQLAGFNKEREISFPHKQSWFGRLRRDEWEGPTL